MQPFQGDNSVRPEIVSGSGLFPLIHVAHSIQNLSESRNVAASCIICIISIQFGMSASSQKLCVGIFSLTTNSPRRASEARG